MREHGSHNGSEANLPIRYLVDRSQQKQMLNLYSSSVIEIEHQNIEQSETLQPYWICNKLQWLNLYSSQNTYTIFDQHYNFLL